MRSRNARSCYLSHHSMECLHVVMHVLWEPAQDSELAEAGGAHCSGHEAEDHRREAELKEEEEEEDPPSQAAKR